jgi:Zn-dependent protease with chaperone function
VTVVGGLAREAVLHTLIAALMAEALLRLWRASLALRIQLRLLVVAIPCVLTPALALVAPGRHHAAFLDGWAVFATERWSEVRLLGLGPAWLWLPVAGGGLLLFGLDLLPWLRDRAPLPPPAPCPPRVRDAVARLAAALGLSTPEVVVVAGPSPLLFCRGVWRPRVVLSTATLDRLDEAQLEGALAHELVHLRRGDVLLGWVLLAVRGLQAFNPVVQLLARAVALDAEERADAGAAALTGRPAALASGLLSMFKASGLHRGTSEVLLGAALARALESNVEARCRRLLAAPEARVAWLDAARLALGGLAVASVLFLVV